MLAPALAFAAGRRARAGPCRVQGVLRMQTGDMGGAWVPMFSSDAHGRPGEVYWPVGVLGGELACIICSAAAQHPRVRRAGCMRRPALPVS